MIEALLFFILIIVSVILIKTIKSEKNMTVRAKKIQHIFEHINFLDRYLRPMNDRVSEMRNNISDKIDETNEDTKMIFASVESLNQKIENFITNKSKTKKTGS